MKALRIAHVDTERTWRGGQQQVYSLVEGLAKRGHANLVIARRGGALAERIAQLVPVMAVTPALGEWDFIAAHFVNRRLRSEKIDVVHAHSAHGASLAAIATLGTGIPVVVTRRVDFPLSKNMFSRWKYGRAKRIVAISEGVRVVLERSGIPKNKITVVPSGVDFSRYKHVKPLMKKELGVAENVKLIGQVAALAPHKDQATLLDAVALLRESVSNVRVVILGEGELRGELEKKIKELKLEDIVQLLGFRDNPLDFIPAFDAFCLSSKEEGLGTSILDAMALHVPVVATGVGGIPEMIIPGKTGYLALPKNPPSLAAELKSCLLAGSQNQLITAQAAEKAKKFDILTTILRMENLYEQLSTGLSTELTIGDKP